MIVRATHRKLAWVAGMVAVLWAATGFLHPIMSWTAPRPAVQAPPSQALVLDDLTPPAAAIAGAGLTKTTLVRLVNVEAKPYWFAARGNAARLAIDAKTGAVADGVEQTHAIALARHYAAKPDATVESVRLVTSFDVNYPEVNRLLPVWEVRFATADGLTLYVDTGLDRLAAVTNDRRRVLLTVFQNVHTLKVLEPAEPVRLAVIFTLIATVITTTAFGAAMLWRARGRGLRRAHTLVAWAALPLVLMFTTSGTLHLFVTSRLWAAPPPQAQSFAVEALPALPQAAVGMRFQEVIASGATTPLWRVQFGPKGYYFGPGAPASDEEQARRLAGASPDAPVSKVTRFGEGYGFINKRLPVWRVTGSGPPVFVDVREGLVALRVTDDPIVRLEKWTFNTLHKWEFLNPIGRRNRDYATMAATAMIILVSLLGLALAWRRRTSP